MFPQPQPGGYYDGFNERLLGAVPSHAGRILEVGCAGGRLGHELKRQDPGRYVVGVERDPDAARAARQRLDEVFELDVKAGIPPVERGSLDCILFGDVLEHLVDPEDVLRRYRELLAPDGLVLASVPNVQHFSVVKSLLRGDFMYQPAGLLDATHLRFFTSMSFAKLMLDAGFLPRIEDRIRSGEAQPFVEAAAPLLTHCHVHPDVALEPLDTFQYIVGGSKLPDAPGGFATAPITFVACVNDDDLLESNLLRSPCLDPGTPMSSSSCADRPPPPTASTPRSRRHATTWWSSCSRTSTCRAAGTAASSSSSAPRRSGSGRSAWPESSATPSDRKESATSGGCSTGRRCTTCRRPCRPPPTASTRSSWRCGATRPCGSIPPSASTCTARTCALAAVGSAFPWPCSTRPACTTPCSPTSRRPSTRPASGSSPSGRTCGRSTAVWAGSTPWSRDRCRPPGAEGLRERVAQLEGALASTRDRLDDRSRHIANMEASGFWKLRNLVHRVLRRG
jgi:SAM-dependent methyltransferase